MPVTGDTVLKELANALGTRYIIYMMSKDGVGLRSVKNMTAEWAHDGRQEEMFGAHIVSFMEKSADREEI